MAIVLGVIINLVRRLALLASVRAPSFAGTDALPPLSSLQGFGFLRLIG